MIHIFLREIELFINTNLFDNFPLKNITVVSSGNQNSKIKTYYEIDELTKTKKIFKLQHSHKPKRIWCI